MQASAGRSPAAAAGDPAIPSLFYPLVASGRMAGTGEVDMIGEGQGRSSIVVDSAKRVSNGDLLTAGAEGWGFYASVGAGGLVGWGADHFLGTDPLFLALGLVAGSGLAFWKLWLYLKGGGQ